jgi:hypothetical protein
MHSMQVMQGIKQSKINRNRRTLGQRATALFSFALSPGT